MNFNEKFKGKKFLVTGGAGFVGSHISETLLGLGARVIVLDDLSGGKLSNLPDDPSLQFVQADITTFDLESLGNFDGIFHEACKTIVPSFQSPTIDLEVNAGGTVRVLEYARRHDIKVVHASSASIYGDPETSPITEEHPFNPLAPYGVSKLAAEHYCKMYHSIYGVKVSILRYFNVFGPRQEIGEERAVIPFFTSRALSNGPIIIHGSGDQKREFLHVSDAVRANMLAYIADNIAGVPINIGATGNEISIIDLAFQIIDLCDSKSEVRYAPRKLGDIRRRAADITRAKELLHYTPTVSFDKGLKDYVSYAKGLAVKPLMHITIPRNS